MKNTTLSNKLDVKRIVTIAYAHARSFTNEKVAYTDGDSTLVVTPNTVDFSNAVSILNEYFYSDEYKNAKQKKVHVFDLDEYEFDTASIKFIETKKYKSVSSLSKWQELTNHLAGKPAAINKVVLDSVISEVFDELMHPIDFFKFSEVRKEYRVSVSLVKNRKVIKRFTVNLGYLTLIHCSKPFDLQESKSKEKKATRASLYNPVYSVGGVQFMIEFNDKKRAYKDLVDMMRI
ncbi:hypothetical protein PX74_003752 [Salmonella enterica subsp. enterica]|nr:hypothetical protein [Salmonella enterica subsp. enterica]